VCACVREGSVWTAKAIMEAEPILTREIRSGALRVVPAYFHMESGVVGALRAHVALVVAAKYCFM
jgi:hypothetical protein